MPRHTALSQAKSPGQRGFLFRILFRPFTFALLLSFFAGVGLIGWLKAGEKQDDVRHVSVYSIAVPQLQQVAGVAVPVAPEVFDFRGAGHGVSAYPRPLPSAPVEAVESAPDMLAADLQAIAPAAGVVAPADISPVVTGNKIRIAIVIDDLGPSYRDSRAAIALPASVTLAFLPYAERLDDLTRRAREAGHEMLVHMPMEPENMAQNNPGPQALTLSLEPDEIRARVRAALDSFDEHVGLNNHMGSRFTADLPAMRLVLEELAQRNQLFFDSRTSPQSVGVEVATSLNMKFVGRDVFLDNEIDAGLITAQLRTLERLARRQGHAVAIGHPYPETISAIRAWLPGAEARGVEIVPLSMLAHRLGYAAVAAGQ